MSFRGNKSALVLMALSNGPREPSEIVLMVNRSAGTTLLTFGSIYVILSRLEDAGDLYSRELDRHRPTGGRPTRCYALTPSGEAWCKAMNRVSAFGIALPTSSLPES